MQNKLSSHRRTRSATTALLPSALGAALLGYVGGEMAVNDLAVVGWIDSHFYALHQIVPIGCAAFIVVVGKLMAARRQSAV